MHSDSISFGMEFSHLTLPGFASTSVTVSINIFATKFDFHSNQVVALAIEKMVLDRYCFSFGSLLSVRSSLCLFMLYLTEHLLD